MDILFETLNLSKSIINSSGFNDHSVPLNDGGIYFDILKKISSLFKDCSLSIFFIENTDYILKSALKKGSKVKSYVLDDKIVSKVLSEKKEYLELKTKEDELFFQNTLAIKLSIATSVFGIFFCSSNFSFDKNTICALNNLVSTISYKIKDYELNEVFKIQLRAMQDAVVEKNSALEVVKKQHKKLQELDKTKNLFLANISHDLRTPLNAIIGFSQALDSRIFGELNEKQGEYIKDIQISSLHLLGMINEILDISKLEANAMKFAPSPMSPRQAIQEAINILEPLYKSKNISVEFQNDFEGRINADYQKFQQILYNLLSNAIKFTPEKGKITIISSAKAKNYILQIQDTGVGIDKKYHNKIFKKFVHLDNVYVKEQNSTGLGLTITKELTKLHNGKITLESELNKGSTFRLDFKNIVL